MHCNENPQKCLVHVNFEDIAVAEGACSLNLTQFVVQTFTDNVNMLPIMLKLLRCGILLYCQKR